MKSFKHTTIIINRKLKMSLEEKGKADLKTLISFILSHENKDNIVNMFVKGPPKTCGFMWCGSEGGKGKWWTEQEANGLKDIGDKVLELGWDSSGYGIMLRMIQQEIKNLAANSFKPVSPLPPLHPPELKRNLTQGGSSIFRDPNFEKQGDSRSGKSSKFYVNTEQPQDGGLKEGQTFAQSYQKTGISKAMDEPNKKALDVMANEGAQSAVNHMMNAAGGDYGRMRSMFG